LLLSIKSIFTLIKKSNAKIKEHLDDVLKQDGAHAKRILGLTPEEFDEEIHDRARAERGVFFTHCGLVRAMLTNKFGLEAWQLPREGGN